MLGMVCAAQYGELKLWVDETEADSLHTYVICT
jgi:hypothetical protein